MQLNNIPLEMRQLNQWVCCGPDKVPINPRNGSAASPTDPNTWASFDEAVRAGYAFVGFVLTSWDAYTIIDLDNKIDDPLTEDEWKRHQKILESFDSYTERSASGRGYHIIVKGAIPRGVRRDKVEVYSNQRYMICTGDVVRNAPIVDYNDLVNMLASEMYTAQRESVALVDGVSYLDDMEIIETATNAANGDKFTALCNGIWEGDYPSQSEADFALLSILCFYTQDNEQVRRLFRLSKLGQRDKATRNDKYIDRSLSHIRASMPPPVDLDAMKQNADNIVAAFTAHKEETPATPSAISNVTLPPGIVGEVAQYIYQTAVRPVPEIALAAAVACVAGIVGRSYNISGTGLNQYIVLLARTGTGKEGATTGIDNLIAAIRPQIPMVDQFIGPSTFASGPALVKVLDERPCFVSILGEFGITLQQLCDPRANTADKTLKKVLLDLYGKSGWNKVLRSSVYSDKEKNTRIVQAPNVTILGESTPETFFNGLSTVHIAEGLIPRFSIVDYRGERPPRNRNAGQPPSADLVRRFAELITVALTTSGNNTCAPVSMLTEAVDLLDRFDTECDAKINKAANEVDSQLWNRAHLKALKLAALVAVGCNPHSPTIDAGIAQWAIDFVRHDVSVIYERFKEGNVGTSESKQEFELKRVVMDYMTRSAASLASYAVDEALHRDKVVPYDYIRRRLSQVNCFTSDPKGTTRATQDLLKDLVEAGVLAQIPYSTSVAKYNKRGAMYTVANGWASKKGAKE